jgi:hypothetical protein
MSVTTAQFAPTPILEALKDRYFRSGPKTHMRVALLGCGDAVTLSWTFTFQDLGSTHSISGASSLTLEELDGDIYVDGVSCSTAEQVERMVFAGHYADYVRELYAFEGIIA